MGLFNHLKKKNDVKTRTIEIETVVVGNSIWALLAFSMEKENQGKTVHWVQTTETSLETILFEVGPSLIRGKNIDVLRKLFVEEEFLDQKMDTLFLKDQKLKSFSGRSKPETLLYLEPFFTQLKIDLDKSSIYSILKNRDLMSELVSESSVGIPSSILPSEKEEYKWQLKLGNGDLYYTNSIIWADRIHLLEGVLEGCRDSVPEFIESLGELKSLASLNVAFKFPKNFYNSNDTIFLPLSYTHEWGHFIGEFREEENGCFCHFSHFIELEKVSEEEISKRIRLLKKAIEKVVPGFEKEIIEEFVILREESFCSVIDDESLQAIVSDSAPVHIVGENAVLPLSQISEFENGKEVNGTVRAILSLR